MSADLDSGEPEVASPGPGSWGRTTAWSVVIWSVLGLAASFTLAIDKVKILQDPSYEPSCNFNPVLSCGSVMVTDQASAFGFPNPYLGIMGFAIMLTVGVVLAAKVSLPRWIWGGAALGSVLGAIFINWLAYQSLYRIGALCPWCMVVWVVTMPMAIWFVLAALARLDSPGIQRVAAALWTWRFTILAAWYLLVFVLILIRFWDYWSTQGW